MKLKNSRKIFSFALIAITSFSTGCAAMIGKPGEQPDMSRVHVGASREEVEKVVGAPLEDRIANFRTGADRQVKYQYFIRDNVPANASWTDRMTDKFSGFERREITVLYGRTGHVMKVTQAAE